MPSLYSHHVYPYLMDLILRSQGILRRDALKSAHGCVLEVGFGTGLNLPYYPSKIDSLTTLDVAKMIPFRVEKRLDEVSFEVKQIITQEGEAFPFEDDQFDCVVTTWTLCSVGEPGNFLSEIKRVLRPDGDYLFLEHGIAANDDTAVWQRRLSWASKLLAKGCRMDGQIAEMIEESGFRIIALNRFVGDSPISLASHMYQGTAKIGDNS